LLLRRARKDGHHLIDKAAPHICRNFLLIQGVEQLIETFARKIVFAPAVLKMIEKSEFTGINEDFEIIFNTAGAGNMNRAKVSSCYLQPPNETHA